MSSQQTRFSLTSESDIDSIDARKHLFNKLEMMINGGHFLDSLIRKCLDPRPKFRPRNIDQLLEKETMIRGGDAQYQVEMMVKLQVIQVCAHF